AERARAAPEGTEAEGRDVEHAAHRVDVRAPIHAPTEDLLRRDVREFAFDLAGARPRMELVARLGDAEIAHLHVAVDRDEDVRWRDVAMHDPERLPVGTDGLVRG